jgi:hypothetical protein
MPTSRGREFPAQQGERPIWLFIVIDRRPSYEYCIKGRPKCPTSLVVEEVVRSLRRLGVPTLAKAV